MKAHLIAKIAAMPAGKVFFTSDVAAILDEPVSEVSELLSELVREGRVQRLVRGLYCKPRKTARGVLLPPDRDRIVATVIRHYDLEAVPMGLTAAWHLGLVEQRPDPEQYAVHQGLHRMDFRDWRLELLPGRSMPFSFRTELASLIVTALPAIGEGQLTPSHATTLKAQISTCPDKEAFREDVFRMPVWIKKYLRKL